MAIKIVLGDITAVLGVLRGIQLAQKDVGTAPASNRGESTCWIVLAQNPKMCVVPQVQTSTQPVESEVQSIRKQGHRNAEQNPKQLPLCTRTASECQICLFVLFFVKNILQTFVIVSSSCAMFIYAQLMFDLGRF